MSTIVTRLGKGTALTWQEADANFTNLNLDKVEEYELASSTGSSMVGYLPEGTGAVTTTVQSKLRETVSVKDFGAVGDGVTDDTAAIQAAIDSVITRDSCELHFSAFDIYRITGTLTIEGGLTYINGHGAEIIHDTPDGNPTLVAQYGECHIADLRIDGKKELKPGVQTAGYGIKFFGLSSGSVNGCHIKNTHEHGVGVYSDNTDEEAPIKCENISITDNYFQDIGNADTGRGCAVWCFGHVEHLNISNNIIKSSVGGITVDDSSASGPSRESHDAVIVGNNITAINDGIRFESSYRGVISGNLVTVANDGSFPSGDYQAALLIRSIQYATEPTNRVSITGNVFRGAQFAVSMGDIQHLTFVSNIVEVVNPYEIAYTTSYAVHISNSGTRLSQDFIISNNEIYTESQGVRLSGTKNVILSGNIITRSSPAVATDILGIDIDSNSLAMILNNDVSGFDTGIFVDHQVDSIILVKGNTVHDNTRYGITISGANQYVIRDNITWGNGISGLNPYGSAQLALNDYSGNIVLDASPSSHLTSGGYSSAYGNTGTIAAMQSVTAANIASAAHAVNTTRKSRGKQVYDSTNNRIMVAQGSVATDKWWVVDGATSVTPS